jgi:hypothetical protein
MRKILPIILLAMIVGGCCIPSKCEYFNSIPERIIERQDSIVFFPMIVPVPIPAEEAASEVSVTDTSTIKTSVAESNAWVEDGRLHHNMRNLSDQMIHVEINVPKHISIQKEYLTRNMVKEVEKQLTWFQKTLIYIGGAALTALLGISGFKLIRWLSIKRFK